MIKGNDILKHLAQCLEHQTKNSHNLSNAFFVPSSVQSTFQALLSLTATLYRTGVILPLIIDQETDI